jgi:hypothetical protein
MTVSLLQSAQLNRLGASQPQGYVPRVPLSFSANHTASYVPSVLIQGDLGCSVEDIQIFPKVDASLIKSLREDLENHAERRLQVMLLQFILVYKSGLSFKKRPADLQIGRGKIKPNPYAACHVATTPSLFCHRETERVVFAQGTPLYYTFNETTLLPTLANQVDSHIDLHHRKMKVSKALRDVSVSILNGLAAPQNEMNPREGFLIYLKLSAIFFENLQKAELKDHQTAILECYKRTVISYQKGLTDNDDIIKKLFGRALSLQVDAEFFQSIQSEIYSGLMQQSENRPVVQVLFHQTRYDLRPRLPKPSEEKENEASQLTGTALKYFALCQKTATIKVLVASYFQAFSDQEKAKDLRLLSSLKSSSTAKKLDLSSEMRAIYEAVLNAIRQDFNVKEPRNMGSILSHLVHK